LGQTQILILCLSQTIKMNNQKQNSGKGCLIALRSWLPNKRGQSAIEFAALMVFILAALLVFQKYIARGLAGRWKGVGDALGQGRIYDPNYTLECEYHPTLEVWYDRTCYDDNCQNEGPPADVGSCISDSDCIDPDCNET